VTQPVTAPDEITIDAKAGKPGIAQLRSSSSHPWEVMMMRKLSLSTLALCALAAGCTTTWEPQYGPVPQVAAANTGRTVHLVTRDGRTLELRNVQVLDDSIVGDTGSPPERVAIATANVQVVSVRKSERSTANTAIVVGGVVLVAITALSVLFFHDLENTITGK
jgi:hypothetical protein